MKITILKRSITLKYIIFSHSHLFQKGFFIYLCSVMANVKKHIRIRQYFCKNVSSVKIVIYKKLGKIKDFCCKFFITHKYCNYLTSFSSSAHYIFSPPEGLLKVVLEGWIDRPSEQGCSGLLQNPLSAFVSGLCPSLL